MAMECLGDSNNQAIYIRSLASFTSSSTPSANRAGEKRKASKPHQQRAKEPKKRRSTPWWEGKSWLELEAELKRQEGEFLREQALEKERHQQKKARRQQKREEGDKRVFKGHRAIFRHHGVEIYDLSQRSDDVPIALVAPNPETPDRPAVLVGEPEQFISGAPSVATAFSRRARAKDKEKEKEKEVSDGLVDAAHAPEKPDSPKLTQDQEIFACRLCLRQFKSEWHLQRHINVSKLHSQNVAYADFIRQVSV